MVRLWAVVAAMLALSCVHPLAGQPPRVADNTGPYRPQLGTTDTVRVARAWRAWVPTGERLEVVLRRTFLVETGQNAAAVTDTFPIDGTRSGTYSLGLTAVMPFAGGRLQGRVGGLVSFTRLVFRQSEGKTFPTPRDSLSNEKLRLGFLDIPLSLGIVLGRDDETRKALYVLELGVLTGIYLGGTYKVSTDIGGRRGKFKFPSTDPVTPLRLAPFARISYSFLGVYAQYRATPFFVEGSANEAGQLYPPVRNWEFGVSVQF